ncbi:MAG: universal stress protein [Candidatus Delongbacteria bacterium]|nr:universal stress protein [Candidatus Delongbacteria bacterium]
MKFDKILFPTDFSIYSDYALADALEFARNHQAELLLLHVIEIETSYAIYGNTLLPAFFYDRFDDMRQATEQRCKEIKERYPELNIRYIIKEGNAFEEILQTEIEENVDCIIMGSHGHTFSLFAMLGSVTEKVVRKSTKPVMVLKYPQLQNHPISDKEK